MAHILVVDDSALIRKQLEGVLTSAGHQVSAMDNALKALILAESASDLALIITDVNMPDMNGIELVIALEGPGSFKKETPIFVLTTESTDHIRQEGNTAGATAWMVKPFNKDALLAGVDSVLKQTEDASEVAYDILKALRRVSLYQPDPASKPRVLRLATCANQYVGCQFHSVLGPGL